MELLDEETNDIDEVMVDINEIKNISLPNLDGIEKMELSELKRWRDKLYPYYYHRTEILNNLGFEEWKKVMVWPAFYKRVENFEKVNQNTNK